MMYKKQTDQSEAKLIQEEAEEGVVNRRKSAKCCTEASSNDEKIYCSVTERYFAQECPWKDIS